MGTPTDQELMDLLDRIAAQDEPALRSLYEATSSRLYGLALRILRHKDWAEDVLQTATCTSGAAPRATGAR
jgi:RNA polymerase sigma-70 factor (ECF subfamily)